MSGKTLNATSRTLAELNIEAATLTFRSMAADTFTWTARLSGPSGTGTIIPDERQVVEVFNGSTRKFRGYVSRTRTGLNTVQVVVANAWWVMEQTDLTSVRTDDAGGTEARHKYVCAKGPMRDMTIDLIDRMIAIGIPMQRGTVAAMYNMTQVTLSRMSCAQALARLLQRCPDAVTSFSYAGASGTEPTLYVSRRNGADAMSAITYTIGTDNIVRGETDLQPRHYDLVERVEVHYLGRHATTQRLEFKKQSYGSGTIATTQRITIAGDELVAFLPQNDYETYSLQTLASASTFVSTTEGSVVSVRKQYGSAVDVAIFSGSAITTWRDYNASGVPNKANGTSTVGTTPLRFTNRAGNNVSLTGRYFVISGAVPDWVRKLPGLDVKEGTLSGMMGVSIMIDNFAGTVVKSIPPWVTALGLTRLTRGIVVGTNYLREVWAKPFTMQCTLVSTNAATAQTLYKPASYKFDELTPGADMAQGLLGAQSWTPWEGKIVLVDTAPRGTNLINFAVNLAGALSPCATMKALAKSLSYDLITGRITWELGPPARMDFGTSSGRVPGSSQDLVDYVS